MRVGWPVDAIVIAVVVVLNAVLGYVQEARAESAVAALQEMTAVTSAVLRDGRLVRIPSDQLVRGDLLVLAEGDAVGADARLTEAAALRVLEASLTGESEAVEKNVSALPGPAALGDRRCMVFKGTAVAQGTGRAIVTATGMATEMGSIADMLEATQEEPTPLQTEVGRIGRMLGIAVIIIAVVVVVTVFVISDVRTAAMRSPSCCSGFRWPWPPCRKGYRRSCRWCWRWVCSGWPRTGPLSRSCPRWRRWALPR